MIALLILSLIFNLILAAAVWSVWGAFTDLLAPLYGMVEDLSLPYDGGIWGSSESADRAGETPVGAPDSPSLPGAAAYEELEGL